MAYGTPSGPAGDSTIASTSNLIIPEPRADVRPIAAETAGGNLNHPNVLRTASLRRGEGVDGEEFFAGLERKERTLAEPQRKRT